MGAHKVVGIGGVFLKAKDPEALKAWYRQNMGFDIQDWGGLGFSWSTPDRPDFDGATIWSLFSDTSDYFAPSTAKVMVNYVVEDLDASLAALRAGGCAVDDKIEESEFGRFGWVMDPEGNKLELWQPPSMKPARA
ncbi:MAG: VOC family protein [Alphaproteobacteria bacterium]|nr:VOC family protein [Alphaproteobacteria bacterium]